MTIRFGYQDLEIERALRIASQKSKRKGYWATVSEVALETKERVSLIDLRRLVKNEAANEKKEKGKLLKLFRPRFGAFGFGQNVGGGDLARGGGEDGDRGQDGGQDGGQDPRYGDKWGDGRDFPTTPKRSDGNLRGTLVAGSVTAGLGSAVGGAVARSSISQALI